MAVLPTKAFVGKPYSAMMAFSLSLFFSSTPTGPFGVICEVSISNCAMTSAKICPLAAWSSTYIRMSSIWSCSFSARSFEYGAQHVSFDKKGLVHTSCSTATGWVASKAATSSRRLHWVFASNPPRKKLGARVSARFCSESNCASAATQFSSITCPNIRQPSCQTSTSEACADAGCCPTAAARMKVNIQLVKLFLGMVLFLVGSCEVS